MNKYLRKELESEIGLKNFYDEHPELLDAIPEMEPDVLGLNGVIADAIDAGIIQEIETSGITKDVKAMKSNMAKVVCRIAKKARPKARNDNNNELFDALDHAVTYIMQAPKILALSRAKAMRKVIKDNATYFSNIKPADFAAMDAAILAYDTDFAKPRYTIDYKHVAGTTAVFNLIHKGFIFRDNIVDYVCGYYEEEDPELVDEMKKQMGTVIEGVHHTGIEALCVDGKPAEGAITNLLQDVEMMIVELKKVAISDINGLATLIKFTPGTYHVTFKKTGYVDKEMILHFKKGVTVHITVEMLRA